MEFNLNKTTEILERTPAILESMLLGVSEEWQRSNEGENTWSPYEVIGHLIHGEKTDWIPRAKIILSDSVDKSFEPFDMSAHLKGDQAKPLADLLAEFKERRIENLATLKSLELNDAKLLENGIHPALGKVSLKELLSAWVVHDLGHIAQISRVLAKQYKNEVGSFKEYIRIIKD